MVTTRLLGKLTAGLPEPCYLDFPSSQNTVLGIQQALSKNLLDEKVGKGPEQTLLQGGHTEGP